MMCDLTYMSRGNKVCILIVITTVITIGGSLIGTLGTTTVAQETGPVLDPAIFNSTTAEGGNVNLMPNMNDTSVPTGMPVPPGMPLPTTTQAPTPLVTPNIMASPQPQPVVPQQPTPQPVLPPTFPPTPPPIPISTPPPIPVPVPVPISTPPPIPVPVPPPLPVPVPVPSPTQPTQTPPGAPIAATPPNGDLAVYPFAVVYECDWLGQRIDLKTKTKSDSVIRLCIEPPILDASQQPVEVSYLSWFVFTRQPYEDSTVPLQPLTQHAVVFGKPDPFGLTVLNCSPETPVCKLATDLRDDFFTDNAYLLGRGELVLQFKDSNQIAGMAPVSIYFLLNSVDIQEPITLLGLRRQQNDAALSSPPPPTTTKHQPDRDGPKKQPKTGNLPSSNHNMDAVVPNSNQPKQNRSRGKRGQKGGRNGGRLGQRNRNQPLVLNNIPPPQPP